MFVCLFSYFKCRQVNVDFVFIYLLGRPLHPDADRLHDREMELLTNTLPCIIRDLVDIYERAGMDLMGLRFIQMCLLRFAVFLRIEELLSIRLQELTIFEDHLEVNIPYSKTDQHRHGDTVFIARTGSKYCPVAYLEKFLQLAKLDVNNDGGAFVIPRLFKTKHGYTASKTAGISYTSAGEIFNRNIQIVTEKNRKYGLHSLRAGGASAAANHGVSDRLIS